MKSIKLKISVVFFSGLISVTAFGEIIQYEQWVPDPDNSGNAIMQYYYCDTATSQRSNYEAYAEWQASESLKDELEKLEPNLTEIKPPEFVIEGEDSSSSASGSSSSASSDEVVVNANRSWWDSVVETVSGWWDSVVDTWNSFEAWLERQAQYWWSILWG